MDLPTKWINSIVGIYQHYSSIIHLALEKAVKYWYATSEPAILEVLGNFIQQTRLQ